MSMWSAGLVCTRSSKGSDSVKTHTGKQCYCDWAKNVFLMKAGKSAKLTDKGLRCELCRLESSLLFFCFFFPALTSLQTCNHANIYLQTFICWFRKKGLHYRAKTKIGQKNKVSSKFNCKHRHPEYCPETSHIHIKELFRRLCLLSPLWGRPRALLFTSAFTENCCLDLDAGFPGLRASSDLLHL